MSKSVGVKKKSIWRDKASWELLMLCVPTLLAFTLFHYVPMIGIILPFKRFMPAKGLFGSPWVGFENFRFLFTSSWRASCATRCSTACGSCLSRRRSM